MNQRKTGERKRITEAELSGMAEIAAIAGIAGIPKDTVLFCFVSFL